MDALQSGLGNLREEARQFVKDSCQRVKSEVMEVSQIEKDLKDQVMMTAWLWVSGVVENLRMHPITFQGYQIKNIRVMKDLHSGVECREGEGHSSHSATHNLHTAPNKGLLRVKSYCT